MPDGSGQDKALVRRGDGGGGQKRRRGGPPSGRGNGPKPGANGPGKGGILPSVAPELPPDTPALRAERVEAIRRDLIRRRRRRAAGMVARLAACVLAPTLLVAVFLWGFATDLYRSETIFLMQSGDFSAATSPDAVSMMSGGQSIQSLAHESAAVQSFILSREMLRALDNDTGFLAHFQRPEIDVFHRLAEDASFEDSYAHYLRLVTVHFDPIDAIIEVSIVGADSSEAQRFAASIIANSEAMVDRISARIRDNTLRDARENVNAAEQKLLRAEARVTALRKELATFSVESELANEMSIIQGLETERERQRGRLADLGRVAGPGDPRVQRLEDQVAMLDGQIAARRQTLSSADNPSLADISAKLEEAGLRVETAKQIFAAAIASAEVARVDTLKQHRYLSVIVPPSRPDVSNYPDRVSSTGLAFLGSLGLYIVVSLTLSLIREQAGV